jgi:alcohol dehydrogenase, propanol-preferring
MQEFGSPLKVTQMSEPQVKPSDVLVKVGICGMCYSDVKVWTGRSNIKPSLPHILGHEIAGTVEKTGEGVSGFKHGDRVIVYLYDTCDKCRACTSGRDNECLNQGPLIGFSRSGGFAEYVSVPSKNLFKIPDNLDLSSAAILTDSVLTPYHAIVDRAQVRLNETAMLIGMGGLALSGLQVLKLVGARIIAVSRTKAKLEMAKRLGADATINSTESDVVAEARRLTEGYGVDYVFDFVVNADTINQGIRATKRGGNVVLLGYAAEPVPISTGAMVQGLTSIHASRAGTRQNMRDIISLASEGKIKSTLTQTYELEEVNKAMQLLAAGDITGRIALRIGS